MGQKYEQLSLEQRCTIARHSEAGKTMRQIAAAMDRAPSTICVSLNATAVLRLAINRPTLSSRPRAVAGGEADCFVSPLCRPKFCTGWDKAGRRPKSLAD